VLAFAAERAVELVLRIAAANLAHFRAAFQDATALVNFSVGHFVQSGIYTLEAAEEGLASHAYRKQTAYSVFTRQQPIMMGYSTKRSNRHFLRAMLLRSISSVKHTTVKHVDTSPWQSENEREDCTETPTRANRRSSAYYRGDGTSDRLDVCKGRDVHSPQCHYACSE
jgi:hypothetical protein